MDQLVLKNELVSFLNTVTKPGFLVDGMDDDTNLVDAGIMDSLALIQIIFYLEQNHDLHLQSLGIDPGDLATINGIMSAIERANA